MKKEKLWTTSFIINMLLNFIYYLVFYIPTIVIGTHAMAKYHASAGTAGILTGLFIVGSLFARLWTGNNIGKWGAKKMLYIGTSIYLLFGLVYYIVPSVESLLLLRFLHGIGFGIATTASGTLAGATVPPSRRGEGIGYYALSVTMSSAIGPFLSMFLYGKYGFTLLIHLSNVLLFIALIGVFFIKAPHTVPTVESRMKKKFAWSKYFEKKAVSISVVGMLIGVSYSSILAFMNAYSSAIGLTTAGSLFFLIYALAILFSRPVTGRIFDTKGDNYVMYPVFILFAIGLTLIGWAQSSFVLLFAAIFIGLGYGSFSPFGQAIAIRSSGIDRIGVSTSTFFGFLDMGVGFGPFIMGLLVPFLGYRNLYYVSAIFTLFIIVIYYFTHGKKVKKEVQ
ncbi:MFS transporter [Lactococcus garvieae]|uniref:Transporter n=1 Tax=Lactococcus garvieae DCC43 TaxID=1231377 RepID=K2PI90_9LACT|nr:MFS transporter [Lactococcus garvieae]EKF51130.1 transporter [Lactococcus garvieae DCC43]